MAKGHPVHTLKSDLEAARLRALKALAAMGGAFSPDALRELATLQGRLTAVREEIVNHGAKLGWAPGDDLA